MRAWEIMGTAWRRLIEGVNVVKTDNRSNEMTNATRTRKPSATVQLVALDGEKIVLPKIVANRLAHLDSLVAKGNPIDITDMSDEEAIRLIGG